MSFYKNHVYPRLVDILGNPRPIRKIREQMIPLAQGNVLEIGAGSGANFIYYDPTRVAKLYALEPNPGMIQLAQNEGRRTGLKIEYLDLPGERVPLEHATVDTVVSTFTLCTVDDIEPVLKGIARVLKPDGRLIFIELGLSSDPQVQHRQHQLEPIFNWLFQGMYLTRDIPTLLRKTRFQIKQMQQGYIAEFPKSPSYCWWGIAETTPQPRHSGLHQ